MTYPIKSSQRLAKQAAVDITFRPAAAGLVNVVLVGHAVLPPPQKGETLPTVINLSVELLPPGAAKPVIRIGAPVTIKPGEINRAIFFADTPAAATQIGADWIARVTNHSSDLEANFELTIRYQVVAGNLGKIDHLFVLGVPLPPHACRQCHNRVRQQDSGSGAQFITDDSAISLGCRLRRALSGASRP